MLVDTHFHLIDEEKEEQKEIISRAHESGVDIIILGGTSKDDNIKNIEIAKSYKNVFVEVGYHPSELEGIVDEDYDNLEKLIIHNKDVVVAVGEIGLDYHYGKDDHLSQIDAFERQLKMAEEYNIPVVIHSRDATYDTINILKKYNVKGIIHCFSGSLEVALEYIKMGYYLGIGGVVTFKNSKLKDVVSAIGLENIVLETDSPYLSPFRGEKNEPKNISVIAKYISELKNVSLEEVANITTNNVIRLFDLDGKL